MSNFSKDQLKSIAQDFHDLSTLIAQFRLDQIHGGTPLDDPEIVKLLGLQWNLMNTSASFYVQAAQVALANADQAATQITAATKAANDAIGKLQVINTVFNIGSAAGVLAAAIMTGDMGQIGTAAKGIYSAIKG